MIDIEPATQRMAGLVASIAESDFGAPTPCSDASLGDLIDHVRGVTLGFTAAARKETSASSGPPPRPDAANLEPGWKDRIRRDLDALAAAWRDPDAWTGITATGPVDLPGEVAGLVVLDELVVHGWDIAVASGQPYHPSVEEIEAATAFVTGFDAPRDGTLFGPVVEVDDSAPPMDRLLGLTGRDPGWRPPPG